MELLKITESNFNEYYSLLERDFCLEERRSKQDEFSTMKNNSKFFPCFIFDDQQLIGYICYWEFEEFVYIEHFAILKDLRKKHFGTKCLKSIIPTFDKRIILEVERPIDDVTKKRISFYEHLGFVVNNFDYHQPSYHKENNDNVPMFILSYSKKLSDQEYQKYIDEIKTNVYPK